MSFRLYIDADGDVFADRREFETARLLREVADRLEQATYAGQSGAFDYYQTIHDADGNGVGGFAFKPGRVFE